MTAEQDFGSIRRGRPPMIRTHQRGRFDIAGRQPDNVAMEAHVASLETKVDRLSDASQRIEATVAEMSGMLKATLPNLLERAQATDGALTELQVKLATTSTQLESFEKATSATLSNLATQEALDNLKAAFNGALPNLATTEALKHHPTKSWTLWLLGGLVALIAGSMAIGAGLKAAWGPQSQAAVTPAAEKSLPPPRQ